MCPSSLPLRLAVWKTTPRGQLTCSARCLHIKKKKQETKNTQQNWQNHSTNQTHSLYNHTHVRVRGILNQSIRSESIVRHVCAQGPTSLAAAIRSACPDPPLRDLHSTGQGLRRGGAGKGEGVRPHHGGSEGTSPEPSRKTLRAGERRLLRTYCITTGRVTYLFFFLAHVQYTII